MPLTRRLSSRRSRNAGAALLAAMLTVTLVAAFASTAAWQQWQAVEIESAERSRIQAGWILVGALDWARLILIEDGRAGGVDHLAEPWSVTLQETRLSSFLAADKNNTPGSGADNQLEVFLSGRIEDMQSRLNVTNLVNGDQLSEPDFLAFSRLFTSLDLPQSELAQLAAGLRAASGNSANASATVMPQRLEQLAWLGLRAESIARLRPYVGILPVRTPVNLNTASAEVIYASIAGLEMAQAQRLVEQRALKPFQTLDDAARLLGGLAGRIAENRHSVATQFFEVHGRLRMERTLIEERSLVQRNGLQVRTLWRERAAAPLAGVIAGRIARLGTALQISTEPESTMGRA